MGAAARPRLQPRTVIAVGTNILVYAHREDRAFHAPAREAMARLAEAPALWAITWPCLYEFYSVITHPQTYRSPTPIDMVPDQINAWIESPTLALLHETSAHWLTLRDLLAQGRAAGPRMHDDGAPIAISAAFPRSPCVIP